jgi:hypothetical protein
MESLKTVPLAVVVSWAAASALGAQLAAVPGGPLGSAPPVDSVLEGPVWSVESDQPRAGLGSSVASAGDVNGDGFDDVIVGAYAFEDGQSREGGAFLYLGSAGGLQTNPAWTAQGETSSAAFGNAVDSAGDVNGDGFDDVIVGAYLLSAGEPNEGRAFLYLGSPTGLAKLPAWTAEGDQAGAYLGYSVASAGDVNGDGFDDVIVGAVGFANGQNTEGRAILYLGSAAGLAASPAWTVEGDRTYAFLGSSVSTAGDVNGDGYDDVIVGARGYRNGEEDEGRATLYLGSGAGLATTPAWSVEGDQEDAYLGYSVATAGDVNGDGFADVIVGAYGFSNGQTFEGQARLYLGSVAGPAAIPDWTAEGDSVNAFLGLPVAAAGDVNADGFDDVIVGAYGFTNPQASEGRALAYLGSAAGLATSPAWTAEGNQRGASFGFALSGAGDVNGDGHGDVVVGALGFSNGERGEGGAFAYLGSASGLETVPAWTAESDQRGAGFGSSVASAGDVNGDGYGDVIVGAYAHDGDLVDEGRAYVYLGSSAGVWSSPAWVAESNQGYTHYGDSVASAGDVNGDGYDDVIVGAYLYSYDSDSYLAGRAFLYLGSKHGLTTRPAWVDDGEGGNVNFGYSVASAGDVNGDGYGDVLVSAPQHTDDQVGEGRVHLYLGSPAGLSPSPAWFADGDQSRSFFGGRVASAGDVDGDGYGDVLVGAWYFDNGQRDEGRAYLYLGSAAGLPASPAWAVEGDQVEANLGCSVASAGDVNGDGFSDVVVGAYRYSSGQTSEGQVRLYLGSAAGLATIPDWTAESDAYVTLLGFPVASAGDVNGDGYDDVIAGAYNLTSPESGEGGAFLWLGSAAGLSTTPAWSVESNQRGAGLGFALSGAGDVNGDGKSDVIVSAPHFDAGQRDEGRAFVYLGN